jgi:hypothetical protein
LKKVAKTVNRVAKKKMYVYQQAAELGSRLVQVRLGWTASCLSTLFVAKATGRARCSLEHETCVLEIDDSDALNQ